MKAKAKSTDGSENTVGLRRMDIYRLESALRSGAISGLTASANSTASVTPETELLQLAPHCGQTPRLFETPEMKESIA